MQQDDFICPECNRLTRFDGAREGQARAAVDIRCECGERYMLIVNEGCRVLDMRRVTATPNA